MNTLRDEYTTSIDPDRAALIPAIQRAARDEVEYLSGLEGRLLGQTYAQAVDDILSWLDGEQSDNLIGSARIRAAASGKDVTA